MLTKKELADKLSVSISTINRMMVRGMPYIKVGKSVRFSYEDVVVWLKVKEV